jgi:exonuclease SbcC
LSVGEPCPVCTQAVSVLPDSETPTSLDDAEQRVAAAQEALASAQEIAAKTATTASQSKADAAVAAESETAGGAALDAARVAATTDRDAVSELRVVVAEKLGEGDPQDRLAAARRGVDEAEAALTAASADEESARTALKAIESGASKAKEHLGGLRTELAAVAGALDVSVELTDGGSDISHALVVVQEALLGKQQSATGDQARAIEERDAASAALRDLVIAAGLGESDDVVEVIAAARVERAAVEAEVQLLESRVAELENLATDEAELVASADVLRTIHGDLAPSRFLEFVLDERRRALGDLASEHLEVLTSGRYRFDESGEFLLVDLTAANAVRSPASLSGGETFLASLGLALALAEIVAREGGRLDAFFLDEGFGSLDPEHLDLAMDGVERLVTSGPDRLVVVVSHVPALRDRIEDLVVLDRDAMTGNTQIVAGRTAT